MAPTDNRIPRVYKEGAKILKEVLESKRGLKDIIYSNRNKALHKKLFALLNKYLDYQNSVGKFIQETSLTAKDEFVLKILCTELLYGKKCLPPIENNTIKNIQNAYKQYCDENNITDGTSLFKTTTNCDSPNSQEHFIATKKKLRFVRVNTLMISKEDLISTLINDGFIEMPKANSYVEFLSLIAESTARNVKDEYFVQDYHLDDVLVFLQSTNFHNYAPYTNGSIFLQDKASCFPTHLLSPPPNSVVFDTCAAPGNKTLHLAAYMKNQGNIICVKQECLSQRTFPELIATLNCWSRPGIEAQPPDAKANVFTPEVLRKVYAVDKDPKRFKYMKEVVELAQGSDVVETIFSDIFEVKMAGYSDVEYVLVDPSCSGTGISERAKIDNHREVSSGRLKNLSGFQKDLLGRVCTYFPHVKRIVYCTCSVREEENEQVVEEIFNKFGAKFQVEDLRGHPALKEWTHFGSDKYENGKKCFYALPSDYCTGFFAAVLVRTDVSDSTQKQGKRQQVNNNSGGKKKKQKFR